MTAEGERIGRALRAELEAMREHEKTAPEEVEALVISLVSHLRSWKPESVMPLGTLPEPGEAVQDPRSPR